MKRTNILKSALVMGLLCPGISSFAHEKLACQEIFWKLAEVRDLHKVKMDEIDDICKYSDGQGGGRVIHMAIKYASPLVVKQFLLRVWPELNLADTRDTEGKTAYALARETVGMKEVADGLDVIPVKQQEYNRIVECTARRWCSSYIRWDVESSSYTQWDVEKLKKMTRAELELIFFPNQ